ncbi:MAG: (deoxy)nucleoside triphosphate pyrophosphohydrolase [Ignavibacteriales bacterium]|nr:(deoxy)nucleoside triphosphate pyrophosphohydrolase [Ignavibacteriales bacterium]
MELGTVFPYILPMTKVAVGILKRDGALLVCQRKPGSRYALKWEFPGGKLEPGETVEHCLRRELAEELSVQIQGIDEIDVRMSHYEDGGTFEVAYCFVSRFDGEPRNNVFEQIRWVSPTELPALDHLEGNKEFVSDLVGSVRSA